MKLTITNYLIIICLIFTFYSFYNKDILLFWMNNFFIETHNYNSLIFQFFIYSFIHWSIFHLIFNSLFLYIFWNKIENILWWNRYIVFFILCSIFVWISIILFSRNNTIWINWFTMALLTYYTILLYKKWDLEYKWWITAIIISIIIWFSPEISFVWHLSWVFYGILFYLLFNKLWKN